MIARAVSLAFVSTIILSFLSVRYASLGLLVFVLLGVTLGFSNGNKSKLFASSIFLFLVVLSSFFIHFKYLSSSSVEGNRATSSQNLEVTDRLLKIHTMMQDENVDQKDLLTYIYESITIAEKSLDKANPKSYLDLGYIYEAANQAGIETAKQKALENFAIYCKLDPKDKTCELVQ